ncbi:MAG TPA: ATP phosphoribosyltransferase regulatory subunit, partial [Thermodesulfobacteriota bacterium]
IGHTGLLRYLLGKTGKLRKEVEEALKKKDQETLEKAISKASIPQAIKRVILSLPELYGSKDILSKAEKTGVIRKYVKELEDVLTLLDEFQVGCEINVDLGELRGFNYYTGVTFELISARVPSPLIVGGRYDELIEKYGYRCPATGFAVDIEAVLDVATTSSENNKNHFIVIPDKSGLRREAIRIAELLRENGFKVILELKEDINLRRMRIKENKGLNSFGVILVEPRGKLRLIESRTGLTREFSSPEELLSSVGR